jgi:2-oxoglutarate ferredoxin oxidoreductase subunit alpha
VLAGFEKILVPELNSGQLTRMLRDRYLVPAQVLAKLEGQPFKVGEIRARIEQMLGEEA